MPSMKLFLLGSPRLERDGSPVELSRRKNVALLAYLAVTGTSHTRESLITLLWPEADPSRARASLRRNLSLLRTSLGGEGLVAGRETIGLDPGAGLEVDVDQFRGLLSAWQGHGHPEAEVCPECLNGLGEAVALYRGDFLAGFTLQDSVAFDEWQFFQTEELRRELASALERLVRGHRAREAYEQAIPYARRWLALDPLHEPVHRHLMRLYNQAGQRAAALRQYWECERVLEEELGVAPAAETTALCEEIRTRPTEREGPRPTGLAPRPRHNLPVERTQFVGRETMLAEINDRLRDPNCGLLTLIGPGGSGKTRLALEAGAGLLDDFEDGGFFVSLAPLRSVESIEPTVASALGISFSGPAEPRQQLLAYLREKSLLLILDNFEHLLPPSFDSAQDEPGRERGGQGFVADALRTAPALRILITSRVGVRVRGEHLFPVSGMGAPSVPSTPAVTLTDVDRYDAVKLFTAAARRAQPGFELTDSNLADAVRICHLVGGMPLGILMSAAWVGILTPAAIGDEIFHSLDFLESDQSDVPERQRSMRAVFDHSWKLLTEREREVFQAMSVFRGGFTRQAAQRVMGASLRELKGLVDRSLVHLASTDRYEVHELLRQYTEDKLDQEPGAQEVARDRHCAYYIAALEQWEIDLKGSRQLAAMAEMDHDIENARAAWDWAAERGQVERLDRAIEALWLFYNWRWRYQECEAAFRAAGEKLADVASSDTARVLARILTWQGASSHHLGRREVGIQLARQSLALLEGPELAGQDTRLERAKVLGVMAQQARGSDFEKARRLGEQSLALFEELGERWGMAEALAELGGQHMDLGAFGEAKRFYERSLALSQALGDQVQIASSMLRLGVLAHLQGQLDEAEPLIRKSITISREIMDPGGIAWGLTWIGATFASSGRFAQAQSPLEEASAAFQDLGGGRFSAFPHAFLASTEIDMGQWDRASISAQVSLALARKNEFAQGIGMSLRLLSCLALAEGERGLDAGVPPRLSEASEARQAITEAQRLAREGAAILRDLRDRTVLASALAGLGAAERTLGNLDRARQHLCEALRTLADTGAFDATLDTLPATALLLADSGEHEQAVEIYALAYRYPFVANSRWFGLVFGRHIEAVAATLPPEVAEAARERGRARDLKATVKELLVELEGWQIPPSDSPQKDS